MSEVSDVRRQTLLSPTARNARRGERQTCVLRFLREEIWSSTPLLGQVMGIKTPQGAHKALLALEKDGLVSRLPVSICGRQALSVWGITAHGQGMAFDIEAGEAPISKTFEPHRLKLTMMDHHLDSQRIRLRSEAAGWQNWIPGNRLGKSEPQGKRPDAIVTSPAGTIATIVPERSIKTTKRYEAIVSHYLQRIKSGDYGYVQYLSPTADFSMRLAHIFQRIKAVPVQGQRVRLHEQHYQSFQFCDYDRWPP